MEEERDAAATASKEKKEAFNQVRLRLKVFLVIIMVFSFTPPGARFWEQLLSDCGFHSRSGTKSFAFVRIHVLDVGKADAILLESGGRTALLDAGTSLEGEGVADYLIRQGVTKLDYLFASHPDSDHIGGMVHVMEDIPTGALLRGDGWDEAGQEAEDLEKYLDSHGIPQHILRAGDSFSLGYADFTVLGPLDDYKETNNNSLVLKLTCFDFSALFCGDVEKEAERDLVESGADLSADLLKVAHHGSRTSSTEEFLQAVSPRLAVVSVGVDNNGLPRSEALARLEAAGAYVLRTDVDGNMIFSYNGEEIRVRTGS